MKAWNGNSKLREAAGYIQKKVVSVDDERQRSDEVENDFLKGLLGKRERPEWCNWECNGLH